MRSVLIANRGEIACRIARTVRAMGLRSVAVFTPVDADALHAAACDAAVPIDSYLDAAAIIAAARSTDAEAIHPGYGFLAERAEFAEACAAAGITFIGPSVAAMRAMSDKAAARIRARALGVPCIPGYDEDDQSTPALVAAADRIGYPIMVKARAGGGGRGIRRVESRAALEAALAAARSEARAAFGDGSLFLERAIDRPRHVEVQIFGDALGQVIHLGVRDCSVQRRHQKLIEESPAPGIDAARLGAQAVAIARSVGYAGAGTVEFLVAGNEHFFIEMNTRLQVEHPVTEAVTGLDLVEWQLRVAAGEPLPQAQAHVESSGHAIEVRLCAEDPARDFAPASGTIAAWLPPRGVRVDHGFAARDRVPPDYDSLVAKLIATGATREEARRRLLKALEETVLLGIPTNRAFLMQVLVHPEFVAGAASTALVDGIGGSVPLEPAALALAAALMHDRAYRGPAEWRNWCSSARSERSVRLECAGEYRSVGVLATARSAYRVDGIDVIIHGNGADRVDATVGGRRGRFGCVLEGGTLELACPRADLRVRDASADPPARTTAGASGEVRASVNGRVVVVHVRAGDTVARGAPLAAIEAMKMEQPVLAPLDGTVEAVLVEVGRQVSPGTMLVRIISRY